VLRLFGCFLEGRGLRFGLGQDQHQLVTVLKDLGLLGNAEIGIELSWRARLRSH